MAFERLIHLRLRQPVWCFFWCRCWRVRRPLGALCGWSRRKRCGSNRAAQFSFAYMVSEHELPHVRISAGAGRSEEHTSELQSRLHLVCRLLLEKKKKTT